MFLSVDGSGVTISVYRPVGRPEFGEAEIS
jgi:hypothetical protein